MRHLHAESDSFNAKNLANPKINLKAKPALRLIRIKNVMLMTGLSRSYIYALTAERKFPQSISLVPGGTSKAWIETEVQEWIDQRIAERSRG